MLPIEASSESLTPVERLESFLRNEKKLNRGPNSFIESWKKIEHISSLVDLVSDTMLENFFSSRADNSLTNIGGTLLTLVAKQNDEPDSLYNVRILMGRLGELANVLNRMHEMRLISGNYFDTIIMFKFCEFLEKRVRIRFEDVLSGLRRGKEGVRDGESCKGESMVAPLTKLSLPPPILGKHSVGKVAPPPPPIASLGKVPSGKAIGPPPPPTLAFKTKAPHPPPPPVMVGKSINTPKLPMKGASPKLPTVAQILGPSPQGNSEHSKPVFETPEIDLDCERRKIHWQSIPISRFEKSLFKQKIFGKFFEKKIDFELIKNHFFRQKIIKTPIKSSRGDPPTAAGTPTIGSWSPNAPQICLPSVLERKRIQQIEIFLNRYRNLSKPVLECLVRLGTYPDESPVDVLETIVALFPSLEERESLRLAHERSVSEALPLPKADAFLVDLCVLIPEFQTAAAARIILATFDASYTELSEYFETFNRKIEHILNSEIIVEIFRIIGSLVVFLSDSKSVSFNGFSVDNLALLRKINSFSTKDYSALHCVAEMLDEEQFSDLKNILDDSIKDLLDFDFDDVLSQSMELEKTVTIRLSKIEFKSKEFYFEMTNEIQKFLSCNLPRIDSLKQVSEIAKSNAKYLREYFGENEKKPVDDILAALLTFRKDFGNARQKKRHKCSSSSS